MSVAPWILSWCPLQNGVVVTNSDNPCSHCMPSPPVIGPPPDLGIPPFQTGAVNITQIQYIWSPGQSGPNDPNAASQVVGQMRIETQREWNADFTSYSIVAVETGAFGTFLTPPPPAQFANEYISNLQITYPWYQNQNYALPAIPVGGTGSPADVNAAQQAAIAQAYQVLGVVP